MDRVTLHFNEDEYQLYHYYCSNYYRHYDETRKNSIKILLGLYNQQVVDIQEHTLVNAVSFFYQKKQEFEIECQIPGMETNGQMRLWMCRDILAFLEDLEKIYRLLQKKGVVANYSLIMGAFSKIVDEEFQMRSEALRKTSAPEIDAIIKPLGKSIEKKLGPEVDSRILFGELLSFVEIFNRLSPDVTFNDEITDVIAISLLRMFGKKETDQEIITLLKDYRDQFATDELESVLEGSPRTQDAWDPDFPWGELLKPLRILNERITQGQIPVRSTLQVFSARGVPEKPGLTQEGYYPLALHQKPAGLARRQNEGNRILVNVDTRPHSEVQLAPATDYITVEPSRRHRYKQYFFLTTGVVILIVFALAIVVFSSTSASAPVTNLSVANDGNGTTGLARINSTEFAPGMIVTSRPSPTPTPEYIIIEPVVQNPLTGPRSNRTLYQDSTLDKNFVYNADDYVTIYKNNMTYNGAYKFSFDLKNPPMIILYTVVPLNITDKIWFEPHDAKKVKDNATVIRPSESAFFEITTTKDNVLYDQEGWGGIYGIPSANQEVMFRESGNYEIEFSGDLVTVSTEVLVKREGNI
jgi:hypothetical protein